MSTRATVHFQFGDNPAKAIVYRHSDGYPEGLGKDLKNFFTELEKHVDDPRFGDPSYLAAKWVVWDAGSNARSAANDKNEVVTHPCQFLGVGIVKEDPTDIEHRYRVLCNGSGKRPKVKHEKV